jgi:hypothetical protein
MARRPSQPSQALTGRERNKVVAEAERIKAETGRVPDLDEVRVSLRQREARHGLPR